MRMWRKTLVIVLAIALFTAGLGVIVYVGVARDRLMPSRRAQGTAAPTWTALPAHTPAHYAHSAAGVVREYSPGALIVVMTPIEGDVEQVIILEGVHVEREGGLAATAEEIALARRSSSRGTSMRWGASSLSALLSSRRRARRRLLPRFRQPPAPPRRAPVNRL